MLFSDTALTVSHFITYIIHKGVIIAYLLNQSTTVAMASYLLYKTEEHAVSFFFNFFFLNLEVAT